MSVSSQNWACENSYWVQIKLNGSKFDYKSDEGLSGSPLYLKLGSSCAIESESCSPLTGQTKILLNLLRMLFKRLK